MRMLENNLIVKLDESEVMTMVGKHDDGLEDYFNSFFLGQP